MWRIPQTENNEKLRENKRIFEITVRNLIRSRGALIPSERLNGGKQKNILEKQ